MQRRSLCNGIKTRDLRIKYNLNAQLNKYEVSKCDHSWNGVYMMICTIQYRFLVRKNTFPQNCLSLLFLTVTIQFDQTSLSFKYARWPIHVYFNQNQRARQIFHFWLIYGHCYVWDMYFNLFYIATGEYSMYVYQE